MDLHIILCLLHILLLFSGCTDAARTILFVNETKSWMDANSYCRDRNGFLQDVFLTRMQNSSLIPDCANQFNNYWTGRILIETPFLTLKGCYREKESDFVKNNITLKENSIPLCYLHCKQSGHSRFIVKNKTCACGSSGVDSNTDFNFDALSLSECNYTCGQRKQFCGGEHAVSIYTEYDFTEDADDSTFSKDSNCKFISCIDKSILPLLSSWKTSTSLDACQAEHLKKSQIVCNSTVLMTNVSDWFLAMQQCQNNTITPLSDLTCEKHHTILNGIRLWTTTRRYNETLYFSETNFSTSVIGNNKDIKFEISMNGSLSLIEEREQMKFICVLDSPNQTNPEGCIFSLDTEKDMQTTTITTTSETIRKSYNQITSSKLIYGIIVGASVGIFIIILITLIKLRKAATVKRKQRLDASREGNNEFTEEQHSHDICSEATSPAIPLEIYEDRKSGDYDTTTSKRKHVTDTGDNSNPYSQMNHPTKTRIDINDYDLSSHDSKPAKSVNSADVYEQIRNANVE